MLRFFFTLSIFIVCGWALGRTFLSPFLVTDVDQAQTANTIFQAASITKASIPSPVMTATQMNAIPSPVAGMCVYNTTSTAIYCYNGAAWASSVAGAAAGANADITSMSVVTQLSTAAGVAVHGTNTNNNAAAGYVGEYVEALQHSPFNLSPGLPTGNFGDIATISLTAGDWAVSWVVSFILNGATMTSVTIGVSTTTGNSTTGLFYGDNRLDGPPPTAAVDTSLAIPSYRFSLSGTTSIWGKVAVGYSAGTPQAQCRLSAIRIR